MGCSPSKGQLFAGIYNHQDKALQFGSCESNSHHFSGGTEMKSQTETEVVSSELSFLHEENTPVQLQGKRTTVCDNVMGNADIQETNMHSQEELLTKENKDKKDDQRMKKNGCKSSSPGEKLGKTVCKQSNIDLPQATVKAHQAVYAYLKNNIPKYESLLGLLEKATQTQLSLQPMVTLLALQYEEINQALDEIATEGEQMLEMHGNHMPLPAAQNDVPLNPDMPEAEMNSTESFPDLLQHMLHHSIKKMRLVGSSIKRLGDTSLEETGDYFVSLSQLLAEKLGAKRTAELRLKQVLACVESYALTKPNSEDTALYSEDSGIGVENECHNGSVRHYPHQESVGLGTSAHSSYGYPEGSLPNQLCLNGDEHDVDKDVDAEDSKDYEAPKHEQGSKTDLIDKKISNWSQEHPNQYPLQVNLQNKRTTDSTLEWRDQIERSIRRPKTADDSSVSCRRHSHLWGAQRSRSADCLWRRANDYMVQGQNSFTNDNQKPDWITKRQTPSQFYCPQDGNNGPYKPGVTSSLIPAFVPVPLGKNAVRQLINTFSKGVCDSSNQKPLNGPVKFKGRKRSFLPKITNGRADVSATGKNNTNNYPLDQQFSEKPDEVYVHCLPPPPPEVLMDNSFKKNVGPICDEYGSETQNQRCSTQRQKCCVSQCPQASMQAASLLPSWDSISRGSLNISETYSNAQDFVDESHPDQDSDQPAGDKDKEKDEANGLFQHPQTVNHLCHSTGILAKLQPREEGNINSLSESVGGTVKLGNRDSGEEASILYANNHPPTIPPVSRVRIPSSSYSTYHRVPSPTALPPSPTCPGNGQGETSTTSFTSQSQIWTRKHSDDESSFMTASSSVSFYDARSMFCQENQSASQSIKPSYRATLPRPWGEPKVSKGRLQATCLGQTFRRSIPYKPTLTDHQPLLSRVTESHYQDSESTTLNNKRKEYVAEAAQCSRQDIPVSCSVSGPQEAEAKITDKRD